jgi:hypothetical protein
MLLGPVQPAQAQGLRVGIDGALVLPVGDWSEAASMGFGGLVKIEFDLTYSLALTGRLGYVYHLENSDWNTSTNELPILVGAKFYFLSDDLRPYGAAELGLVNVGATVDTLIGEVSTSEVKIGLTIGGGVEISGLDLRAQLFAPSIGDFGDFTGLMATVGYAFTVF